MLLSCRAITLVSLPEEPPAVVMEIQRKAFSAFSQLDIENSPSLMESALKLVIVLWVCYPQQLPEACNMDQLSKLLKAALDVEVHQNKQAAIKVGSDFVGYFMRVLNDQQLEVLGRAGVYNKLRSLLAFYDEMSPKDLQQIVVGVGMFAEVKPDPQSFLAENLHTSLLFAAQKHHSQLVLQQLLWRLLSLHCQKDHDFAKQLLSDDVLSAVVAVLHQEGSHLTPLLRFLTVCCHVVPNLYIQHCLEKEELMQLLVSMIKTEPDVTAKMEDVINTCDFLSFLCSKCGIKSMDRVFEWKLVTRLEDCARKWPEACMLPSCIAIEGVVNLFPPDPTLLPAFAQANSELFEILSKKKTLFYQEDHHLFVKQLLSDPTVYVNGTLVEMIYVTFQKLLRGCTQEGLTKMYSREFLEFFVVAFIRDTITFPNQANRITFTTHFFIFHMKGKEAVELLREFDFHTAVADLLLGADSYELTGTSMALLACLIGKYYDHFKDIKLLLKTEIPAALIDKVKRYGRNRRSHFGDDVGRVLLNLTADKELSVELFNLGYLEQLMELLQEEYTPVITRCVIHAIGNIALGGQHIKQILLDRKLYEKLLDTLRAQTEKGDPNLLSACCRVLHILASGDWAKRRFVECGCIDTLLKVIRMRKDNPEICWRPLGLLSSLGFMAVVNRRYILTSEVIEAAANILKESAHGKVISYTLLVFLASGELDEGSTKLTELGIESFLKKAIANPDYQKQGPDLDRWGTHVMEKQHLHTISIPPNTLPPPPSLDSDWPPLPDPESLMETEATDSVPISRKLLPLDDSCLKPHHPHAPQLNDAAKEQLAKLGLNPNDPLFRIGRVYGSTYGLCSNCEREGESEELVIRPHSITPTQYQALIDNGWYRRGGVKMFRLRWNHNVHCCDWETRVSVKEFEHRKHKSYKKILRRMPESRLTIETKPTHFNRDAFDLYNEYHVLKHDKPKKSEYSYCEHIVNSPIAHQTVDGMEYGTFHQLYRLDGKLVAIGIIDVVPKGIVSIYMWYNVSKEISKYSFGVYSALKEIEFVRELSRRNPDMQYYYLQGWNGTNHKLAYKANYEPEDFYCPCIVESWVPELTEVNRSRRDYIARKQEDTPSLPSEGTTGQRSEEAGKQQGAESSDNPQGNESTDGAKQVASEDSTNKEASTMDDKEGEKPKGPTVPCEAYPNDLTRYKQLTGKSEVDISKIVVCLNYSEYLYLMDMFERFGISQEQRKLLEKRYTELVVALGPMLVSQLVIDMKAVSSSRPAPTSEPMQVEVA